MPLLLVFATVSIFFSFICSIMEAVLLSITPSFINGMKATKPSLAKQLGEYKKDIDKPLSAVLTLNTIAHTVGAIMVGSQAGKVFGTHSLTIPGINIELSYEGLVAGVMTFAILILSEIIPKTLGANFWRELTPITAKALRLIMFLLYPFIWMSMLITKYMKSSSVHSVFSRDDYKAMTDLGGESGALAENETNIISNLLSLDDIAVRDIMTPSSVVHTVSEELTMREYYDKYKERPFSRIPVYLDKASNMTGFILKNDVYQAIIDGRGENKLESIKRKVAFVHEEKKLKDFFRFMSENGEHMAVVTNEYGTLSGLVSLEDVIETLLGFEIIDELDSIADLQEYARQKWEERAKKIGLVD